MLDPIGKYAVPFEVARGGLCVVLVQLRRRRNMVTGIDNTTFGLWCRFARPEQRNGYPTDQECSDDAQDFLMSFDLHD